MLSPNIADCFVREHQLKYDVVVHTYIKVALEMSNKAAL